MSLLPFWCPDRVGFSESRRKGWIKSSWVIAAALIIILFLASLTELFGTSELNSGPVR